MGLELNESENMSICMETEVLDGYEVSADIKQLWSAELEILNEIDRVCKKYDITYFADWGTLLGAVRHKGFIPWDDDLDIGMLIEDYEKFASVAPKELRKPFFYQSIDTESGFTPYHVKVRNSDTTGATKWEIENAPSWNKGIFVDILPLFPITEDKKRLRLFRSKLARKRKVLHFVGKINLKRKKGKYKILSVALRPVNYKHICQSYIDLCKTGGLRKGEKTSLVSTTSFHSDKDSYISKREWFTSTVTLPFMDRTIPAPIGYKERLSTLYGDYMTPVKGTEFHSDLLFDTSTPYYRKLNLNK